MASLPPIPDGFTLGSGTLPPIPDGFTLGDHPSNSMYIQGAPGGVPPASPDQNAPTPTRKPGIIERMVSALSGASQVAQSAPGMSGLTPEASQLALTSATAPLQKAAQVYSHVAPNWAGAQQAGDLVNRVQANKAALIGQDKSGTASIASGLGDMATQAALMESLGLPGAISDLMGKGAFKGTGYLSSILNSGRTGFGIGAAYGGLGSLASPNGVDNSDRSIAGLPAYGGNEAAGAINAGADVGATMGDLGALGSAVSPLIKQIPSAARYVIRKLLGGSTSPEMANDASVLMQDAQNMGVDQKPSTIAKAIVQPPEEVASTQKATQALSKQLGDTVASMPYDGIEDLQKAQQNGGKRANAAGKLLDETVNSTKPPVDPEDVFQADAKIQALREKMRMDKLADIRTQAAGSMGQIQMPKTIGVIDDNIEQLRLDTSANHSGEIKALEQMKSKLAPPKPALGGGFGEAYPGSEGGLTFQQASATRSGLGQQISDLYKSNNAITGAPPAHLLQPLKDAIGEDISDVAQASGNKNLIDADNNFRSQYSDYADIYHDPSVVKALETKDPDQFLKSLSKATLDKVQRIANIASPKGKAALAQSFFNQAADAALSKRTADYIPGNVSGGLSDRSNALSAVMTHEQLQQAGSIQNLNQALAKTNPQQASALGQRMVTSGVEASSKVNKLANLFSSAKDAITDQFFNTPEGKRFLFSAADAKLPQLQGMNPIGKWQSLLGPMAAHMGAKSPNNQQEYDAIPSGQPYIAQDGTAGVKP